MATTINSGYANSPKLTANIADHADVFGGRSLVFDGISDYLDLGTVNLDTSDFTISMWINFTSIGSYEDIFDNRKASTNGFIIRTSGGGGGIEVLIDAPSNLSITYNYTSTGQWLHLCVSVDRDGNMVLYANGKAEGTTDISALSSGTLNHDAGCRIGANEALTASFHGKMCDFKLFKGIAFSESQVQELYKKPESNPSNTTQYLDRWYPMIEGNPESPQSIVYDHSEKGLGSEAISGTNWGSVSGITVSNGSLIFNTSTQFTNIQDSPSVVSGNLYKLVYTISNYVSGSVRPRLGGTFGTEQNANGTYTEYIIPAGTYTAFYAYTNGSNNFTVENISVKEVLMGNHATTNFFGDDLLEGYGDFSDASKWSGVDNGFSITGGQLVAVNAQNNIYRDVPTSVHTIENGKSYQGTFTISDYVDGFVKFSMGGNDGGTLRSANGTYTETITITNRVNNFIYISATSSPDLKIDNFTVKEVGVSSSGFETAVNEPVVPQVPLMRYNQKMLVSSDASADTYVLLPDGLTQGLTEFTFSIWHRKNIGDTSILFAVDGGGSYIRFLNATRIFAHLPAQTGSFTIDASGAIVDDGNLHHYVLSISASSNESKLYVDGVLKETDTNDGNYYNSNIRRIGNYAGIQTPSMHDEFSIFNTVLSDTEVQELFNDGVAYDATTHSKADDHLLGYWRNDGVTTWKDRKTQQWMLLNGTDTQVNLTTVTTVENTRTAIAWVYTESSSLMSIFSGNNANLDNDLQNGITRWFTGTTGWLIGTIDVRGSWSMVTYQFEQSGSDMIFKTYVNDTLDINVTNNSNYTNGTIRRLGYKSVAQGRFFDGAIAQAGSVASALTQEQITELFNLGREGNWLTTGHDWEFYYNGSNYATGTDGIEDSSTSTARNATITNGGISGSQDGTVQGTPDSITIREGLNSNRDGLGFYFTNPSNNVLRLNGVNEYVSVPHTKSLVVGEQLTLECWAKLDRVTPSEDNTMISKYDEAGDSGREYSFQFPTDKRLIFRVSSAGSSATLRTLRADNAISDGNLWHHYAVTFASGTMKMYVDGSEVSASTSGATVTSIKQDGTANVVVGCVSTSSTPRHFFNGLIDEAKVYNRSLSADEINKNYKHQKGKHKND